jgi:hypothetical protein
MNMTSLHKHYDKLTSRERIAALLDAGLRGDDREHTALLNSAPKVGYTIPAHYFLGQAYSQLASLHLCTLLNLGCAFFMGQGIITRLNEEEQTETFDAVWDRLVDLARSFKIVDASWAAFCKDDGMDPDKMLVNLPGSGVVKPHIPGRGTDTLPVLRKAVDVLYPEPPDAEEVFRLVDSLRAARDRITGE